MKIIDRGFVCFVLFYGPLPNSLLPPWTSLLVCLIAGITDSSTGAICAISVIMDFIYLNKMTLLFQIILVIAYAGGSILQKLTPNDRWVTPYRWIWHVCCTIIIFIRSSLLHL